MLTEVEDGSREIAAAFGKVKPNLKAVSQESAMRPVRGPPALCKAGGPIVTFDVTYDQPCRIGQLHKYLNLLVSALGFEPRTY